MTSLSFLENQKAEAIGERICELITAQKLRDSFANLSINYTCKGGEIRGQSLLIGCRNIMSQYLNKLGQEKRPCWCMVLGTVNKTF